MSKNTVISLWREAHVDCRRWQNGDVGAVLRRAERELTLQKAP